MKKTTTASTLAKTLAHSEEIKNIVAECAEELSSANTALKQELANQDPPAEVEKALETSEEVEKKVYSAAEQLAVVNDALEEELVERARLEHLLVLGKAQEEAALQLAFHDTLTGLPNRLLFNDRLDHGLAQAIRHSWKLAVMFVDLDEFKCINDQYGHETGDAVLTTIANRLKETTRIDDTISRHGGDEFLYLLIDIKNIEDAVVVAKKIISAIQMPCNIGGREFIIMASIGIAMFPEHGTSADDLINSADKAMYQTKRNKSGYAVAK